MIRQPLTTIRTLILLLIASAGLSSADEYDLDWWTIDGGGDMFTNGGEFELSGTIGQPDAGVMTGGEFELIGGFSFPAFCAGDLDGDRDTDQSDLGILLANWGIDDGGDLDGDGVTGHSDLGILLADWGCGT